MIYHSQCSECFVEYLSNQSLPVISYVFNSQGVALLEWFVCLPCPACTTYWDKDYDFYLFHFSLSWPGRRKETQERCFFSNCVLIAQGLFTSLHLMFWVKTIHWRGMLKIVKDKKTEIQHWNLFQGLGYWPWLSEYSVIKTTRVRCCSILSWEF